MINNDLIFVYTCIALGQRKDQTTTVTVTLSKQAVNQINKDNNSSDTVTEQTSNQPNNQRQQHQ